MAVTYKVTMNGVSISDPYALLKAVFPMINGEAAEGSNSYAQVTFATPQTPADLGPLIKVEIIPNP
tara:strand:- start:16 stop:213 length:198 start_codon:yes stop_codon:yes gene_type:complete